MFVCLFFTTNIVWCECVCVALTKNRKRRSLFCWNKNTLYIWIEEAESVLNVLFFFSWFVLIFFVCLLGITFVRHVVCVRSVCVCLYVCCFIFFVFVLNLFKNYENNDDFVEIMKLSFEHFKMIGIPFALFFFFFHAPSPFVRSVSGFNLQFVFSFFFCYNV